MKRRVRLNVQIAGVLSVLILGMVGITGVFTYRYSQNNLRRSILSTLDSIVENNSRAAQDLTARVQACMDLIPDGRSDTLSALLYYDSDMYRTYPYYLSIQSKLEHYLKTMVGNAISRSLILFIVDESMPISAICTRLLPEAVFGTVVSSPQVLISRQTTFEEEPFYRQVLENGGQIHWFTREESADMLYAAQVITQDRLDYSRVKTYDMGMMVIGFDVDWIREQMSGNVLMREASVFIASGDDVIYASDGAYARQSIGGLISDVQTGTQTPAVCRFEGKRCFLWRTALEGELELITLMPQASVQRLTIDSLRLSLILMLAMLPVVLATIILMVKRLVKPIERLSVHMKGKPLEPVELSPLAEWTEETRMLYESFNEQNAKILRLMDDVRAIENEKRRKEIQLLQARINPHFVYNVLDSVSCMALVSGNDDITETLGNLAAILRYNLKDPEALVPFSIELRTIESYLTIQQGRCAEGLSICYDLDEAGMDWLLPKMSVQPLVENAVMHVKGMPHIRIESRVQGKEMTIVVANQDGDADPALLMRYLAGEERIVSRSTGLGIRNVHQRIRMIYGEACGLRYERQGRWLRAILTFPRLSGESEGRKGEPT